MKESVIFSASSRAVNTSHTSVYKCHVNQSCIEKKNKSLYYIKLRTYKFHQDKRSIQIYSRNIIIPCAFYFSHSLSCFHPFFSFFLLKKKNIKQRSQSQLPNSHTIKKQPILKQWPLSILIQLLQGDFSANPNKQMSNVLYKCCSHIYVLKLITWQTRAHVRTNKINRGGGGGLEFSVVGGLSGKVHHKVSHMNPSKNAKKFIGVENRNFEFTSHLICTASSAWQVQE